LYKNFIEGTTVFNLENKLDYSINFEKLKDIFKEIVDIYVEISSMEKGVGIV